MDDQTNATRPRCNTTPARLGHLDATKTLWPGDDGTLKLVRRFGDALYCVRYRRDPNGAIRYTTVELIVERGPVQQRLHGRTIVEVRIAWDETQLRTAAMAQGAQWDSKLRIWRLPLAVARTLGLADRVNQN